MRRHGEHGEAEMVVGVIAAALVVNAGAIVEFGTIDEDRTARRARRIQ